MGSEEKQLTLLKRYEGAKTKMFQLAADKIRGDIQVQAGAHRQGKSPFIRSAGVFHKHYVYKRILDSLYFRIYGDINWSVRDPEKFPFICFSMNKAIAAAFYFPNKECMDSFLRELNQSLAGERIVVKCIDMSTGIYNKRFDYGPDGDPALNNLVSSLFNPHQDFKQVTKFRHEESSCWSMGCRLRVTAELEGL